MDKTELLSLIQTIGTSEDETERRESLATLQDEVTTLFDNNVTLAGANESLTNHNEKLREANMKLFLRVGEIKDDTQRKEDSTGIKEETKPDLKFEDLFNEKGGLK